MHIEYRPSQDLSTLVKRMKGRSSRKLQMEFPELKKKYWGRSFWAIGFGCWSTGNLTDDMVNQYLEHHRNPNQNVNDNFIIEDNALGRLSVCKTKYMDFQSILVYF